MRKILCFLTVFLCAVTMCYGQKKMKVTYPKVFPEEWKKKEVLDFETRKLAPGVTYWHYHLDDMLGNPVSFYFVIADWKKAKVQMKIGVCNPVRLQKVAEIVEPDRKKLLAAINGTYFDFVPPAPVFYTKAEGKVYSPLPKRKEQDRYKEAIVFNGSEFPKIVKCTPEVLEKYENVFQGQWLGRDGVNTQQRAIDNRRKTLLEEGKETRDFTPYTAVGLNEETQEVFFFVADGRHKKPLGRHKNGIAPGIDFDEIAEYVIKLGARQVLQLDGGGSTTMVLSGKNRKPEVVNCPSDNGKFDHEGARSVRNCLYLIKRR